ncbi:hypothetical protein AADZ91_14615 [Colwelliaceae bacterium 6441]
MTTMNVTTLKMIIAAAGALSFITLFAATSQYQEITLKVCESAYVIEDVKTVQPSCSASRRLPFDING